MRQHTKIDLFIVAVSAFVMMAVCLGFLYFIYGGIALMFAAFALLGLFWLVVSIELLSEANADK